MGEDDVIEEIEEYECACVCTYRLSYKSLEKWPKCVLRNSAKTSRIDIDSLRINGKFFNFFLVRTLYISVFCSPRIKMHYLEDRFLSIGKVVNTSTAPKR